MNLEDFSFALPSEGPVKAFGCGGKRGVSQEVAFFSFLPPLNKLMGGSNSSSSTVLYKCESPGFILYNEKKYIWEELERGFELPSFLLLN
jgi:hypothetical protein